MVQRTEVQGVNPVGQASSRSAQVINRAIETPVVDMGSQRRVQGILDGLSGFTDASSQAAYRQAQIQVENSKIDGMAKAVSGGKLGAEATKAEEMGYDIVTSQADLGKANEELANHIAANPEMSDDEFTAMKNERYGAIMAQYQDKSPEVFKAISVKAQESQAALYRVQTEAKSKYQKAKGAETLNSNIGSTLDSAHTVEQGVDLIHQFMGQGKAVGLSEFETKDIIFNQMKLTASQGDNRLLEFVKGTDWGRYTLEAKQAQGAYTSFQKQAQAEAKQAQREYEEALQKQNVFAYGAGLAEIEDLAKSGAPDEQLMAKMQDLQRKGLKFSPSSVASYLTMGQTMSQAQVDLQKNVASWQDNKGNFNLATNPYIPTTDKTKVLDAAESAIVQQSQNVPDAERPDFTISNMIRLSQQEGLPVKTIGTALSSLANIDPQQPMTPAVSTWAKYLLSVDDQTLRMNVPDTKDQAMLFGMRNVLINSQGADDKVLQTAIARGQAVRDNNVPLSSQQTKKITTTASTAVKELRDPTQTTWYFRSESLPSSTSDYITNKIAAQTQNLYQVTQDIGQANQMAIKEFKQNNMILTDGVIANIGVRQFAAFVPGLAKPGEAAEDVQRKAVSSLDYQIDNVIKAQSKDDGVDYKRSDVKVMFTNSGATYQLNVGGLNVGTFPTSGLQGQFDEGYYKKWTEAQNKQQQQSQVYHDIKDTSGLQNKINSMGIKY